MNFIYNETLSGVIDWVNKQFTTLNNIEKIEEVYLWGIAYRDVSFVWNIVTFNIAPPVGASSPTIDYFIETVASPSVLTDVTFWEVIDETYDIISEKRKAVWPYKESFIKRLINKGVKRIKNMRVYKNRIQSYTFNQAADGSVNGYNASSINIWEKDYVPSSWAIMLWNNSFVRYNWYTGGSLVAIAWYVYSNGDKYSIGYKVPEGVKRPAEVSINGVPLEYVDMREWSIAYNNKYTYLHDSTGDRYIFLPYTTNSKNVVTVSYTPDYVLYTDDADIIDIDYEYTEVLTTWVAYKALLYREDERALAVKEEHREAMREFKVFKWKSVDWINNKIRSWVDI